MSNSSEENGVNDVVSKGSMLDTSADSSNGRDVNDENDGKGVNDVMDNGSEILEVETKGKRKGKVMTKDDFERFDGEEEEVVVGSFQKAPDEVLKQRRILKVPRNDSGQYVLSSNATRESLNPFGSVNLGNSSGTCTDKEPVHSPTRSEPSPSPTTTTAITATTESAEKSAARTAIFGASTTGFFGFPKAPSPSATSASLAFGGFGSSTQTSSCNSSGIFGINNSFSGPQATAFGGGSSGLSFGGFGSVGKSGESVIQPFVFPSSSLSNSLGTGQVTDASISSLVGGQQNATGNPIFACLPSDYELRSGEEDEIVLFSKRCRTYRMAICSSNQTSTNAGTECDAVPSVPPSIELLTMHPSSLGGTASQGPTLSLAESDKASTGNPGYSLEAITSDNSGTGKTVHNIKNIQRTTTSQPVQDQEGAKTDQVFDQSTLIGDVGQRAEKTWLENGIGPLKVLQTKKQANVKTSFRLVQRRESTPGGPGTTVILNLRLIPSHTTIDMPTEKHVRLGTAAVSTMSRTSSSTNTVEGHSLSKISSSNKTTRSSMQTAAKDSNQLTEETNENERDDQCENSHPKGSAQPGSFLFKFKLASEANEFVSCLQSVMQQESYEATNEKSGKTVH